MASRPLKHDDVLQTVETRCPTGHPQVLRCYPLRTGGERFEPFPTMFWLVCPQLVAAVSRLEHEGWITRLATRMETDDELRAGVERDHEAYAAERWEVLSANHQAEVVRRGLEPQIREHGIGGIRNRSALKCLHLHYAFHLARGSTIGRELDALGTLKPCAGGHDHRSVEDGSRVGRFSPPP